jgi:Mn-containing catalase
VQNTNQFIKSLYTYSDKDFTAISDIWKGKHPEDGLPLEVIQGVPEGYPIPEAPAVEEEFAPGISAEDFKTIAARLTAASNIAD